MMSRRQAATAWPSVHASSAALAVPAAAWGRAVNAASPIRHVRPKAMRGTSRSNTTWTNGPVVLAIISVNGGDALANPPQTPNDLEDLVYSGVTDLTENQIRDWLY